MAERTRHQTGSWAGVRTVAIFLAVLMIVFATIIAAVVWAWWSLPTLIAGQLSIAALFFTVFMGWAVLRAVRVQRYQPAGVRLSAAADPQLYQLVTEVATFAEAEPPDEIWLTTSTQVEVIDESRWLGLRGRTRYLLIGYAVFVGVDARELGIIVANALGRYSAGAGWRAVAGYRSAAFAHRLVHETGLPGLVGIVLRAYGNAQLRGSRSAVRAQVQRADTIAAELAGGAAARVALSRAEVLAIAWELFLDQYLRWGWESGYRPLGCLVGFQQLVRSRAGVIADLIDELPEADEPWDIDIALPERLAAVMAIEPSLAAPRLSDAPATELIDLGVRTDALEAVFMAGADREALPWPEFMARAATASSRQAAAELYRGAARVAKAPDATMATVLDLLEQGHDVALVEAVTQVMFDDEDYFAARQEVGELIGNAAAAAAVDAGVAWWRMSWDDPIAVVGADSEPQPWHDLADDALNGRVEPLRTALAELGIDAGATRQTSVGASIGQNWIAALSDVKVDGFSYDALLHTGGLVLAPIAGIEPSVALADGRRRLSLWFDMLPSDVAKLAGATELAPVDIVLAQLQPGRPLSGQVRLLDGRTVAMKASRFSAEAGEGTAAIADFLTTAGTS